MKRLSPGEIDGMRQAHKMVRPGQRTRLMRYGGYLLVPGTFVTLAIYSYVARTLELPSLLVLSPLLGLGFFLLVASRYTQEFCRTCDRPVEKRIHSVTRDRDDLHGYVAFCPRCHTYEEFLSSSD